MGVVTTTPAESRNLTTLANLKLELGITDSADDSLLTAMIAQASAAIESYCGRVFALQTYTETLPGSAAGTLTLGQSPLRSVASVTFRDALVDADLYSIIEAGAGQLFKASGWGRTSVTRQSIISWPVEDEPDYVAVYDAGYVLPTFAAYPIGDGTDLPADVEAACIQAAKATYSSRSRDPNLKSEKVGDFWSASYGNGSSASSGTGLPDVAVGLIGRHRRSEVF